MRDEGRGGAYPPDGQDGGGEDGGERQEKWNRSVLLYTPALSRDWPHLLVWMDDVTFSLLAEPALMLSLPEKFPDHR